MEGFFPSGGSRDALPIPLGSLSTLGLAGPKGMPLIGEFPAPAVPAGGVSCALALPEATRLPSRKTGTSTQLRNIELSELASRVQCKRPDVAIKALCGRLHHATAVPSDGTLSFAGLRHTREENIHSFVDPHPCAEKREVQARSVVERGVSWQISSSCIAT